MPCFYTILWVGHLMLGIAAFSEAWSVDQEGRTLILGWCAIIVPLIPFSLLAMTRTQVLEITENGIIILRSMGMPFSSTRKVSLSPGLALNLVPCCWESYHLLVLEWGRMPWQCADLAPLTSTSEKKSIDQSVSTFLAQNHIQLTSNPIIHSPTSSPPHSEPPLNSPHPPKPHEKNS